MFQGLRNEIIRLNSDVKSVANSEKAKKLRKKLMSIGLPLMIIGYVGALACFIAFTIGGFSAVGEQSFGLPTGVLIPFFLLIPFGIMGAIGTVIFKLALSIIITGYAADLVEETVGNVCPKCKKPIEANESFCSKCGAPLTKKCASCGESNELKNEYCSKCGNKL